MGTACHGSGAAVAATGKGLIPFCGETQKGEHYFAGRFQCNQLLQAPEMGGGGVGVGVALSHGEKLFCPLP